MNWHDLELAWRRQALPVGATADLAQLKNTFEDKHRKMQRALLMRDVAEMAAAVFVAVIFGAIGLKMGAAGWPMAVAVALMLGVAAVFARERVRIRRHRLGADAAILAKVDAELAELARQRQLLNRVWVWYLGPVFLAEILVMVAIFNRSRIWRMDLAWPMFAGFLLFFAAINAFAWWINRSAVRRQIDPRIVELEKLRSSLTA